MAFNSRRSRFDAKAAFSGQYRRLYFEILLVRNMGFYSMNIVIPSMLIVTISWVSYQALV